MNDVESSVIKKGALRAALFLINNNPLQVRIRKGLYFPHIGVILYVIMLSSTSFYFPVNTMQRLFALTQKTSFALVLLFALSGPVFGADINFSLQQKNEGNRITITVQNNSASAATMTAVEVELDNLKYAAPGFPRSISPHTEQNVPFTVAFPKLPGSYPLIVTLRYLNDGTQLSLNHVGLFHFQQQAPLSESCVAEDAVITQEGEIIIRSSNPSIWKPVLPDEVALLSESAGLDRKIVRVKNMLKGFNNNYPFYAVAVQVRQGIHYAAVCSGALRTRTGSPADEPGNGKISKWVLLTAAVIFLIAFIATINRAQEQGRLITAVNKYASRLFLITIGYLVLKSIDDLLSQGGALSSLAVGYDVYKRNNFGFFYHYFVDAYWIATLVLVFPFLYYFDAQRTADQDKYSNLVKSMLSLVRGRPSWSKAAQLGMLTVFVKFFYIPLLVTWVINNTLYQFHLTHTFQWDLSTINAYLVALFIYIDTAIYCFGYLFEFAFLKNTIKTVEPTVLGWVVCLWCYPPFNNFSFRIFDHEFVHLTHSYPPWVNAFILCLITVLWGVFAWASLSLGWKASNLTNRGIVRHGPYRFVRHPAYAAKLFLWYLQGIFFGQYFIGIMFGFTLIYILRAWTEERHLSLDPEYREYRKIVKWRFIPGIV